MVVDPPYILKASIFDKLGKPTASVFDELGVILKNLLYNKVDLLKNHKNSIESKFLVICCAILCCVRVVWPKQN